MSRKQGVCDTSNYMCIATSIRNNRKGKGNLDKQYTQSHKHTCTRTLVINCTIVHIIYMYIHGIQLTVICALAAVYTHVLLI